MIQEVSKKCQEFINIHRNKEQGISKTKNYGTQDQARATDLCDKVTKMFTFSTLRNGQGQILVQFSSNDSSKGRKICMWMDVALWGH